MHDVIVSIFWEPVWGLFFDRKICRVVFAQADGSGIPIFGGDFLRLKTNSFKTFQGVDHYCDISISITSMLKKWICSHSVSKTGNFAKAPYTVQIMVFCWYRANYYSNIFQFLCWRNEFTAIPGQNLQILQNCLI